MTEKNATPRITERLCKLFSAYDPAEISVSPFRISKSSNAARALWLKPKGNNASARYFADGERICSARFELCLLGRAVTDSDRLDAEALLEDVFAFGAKNAEEDSLSLCEASPVTLQTDGSDAVFALSFTAHYTAHEGKAEDRDSQSVTISDGVNSLELSSESFCPLTDGGLEGFDFPETVVKHVTNALDDGAQIIERHFAHRILRIRFEVIYKEAYKEIRDTVLKLMNPHGNVTVTARSYGRKRIITATPYSAPVFSASASGEWPQVSLSFICEDPFFKEDSPITLSLPITSPALVFPMTVMKSGGVTFALCEDTYIHTVNNPGDAACGFVATLTAEHGTLTQPGITLGTKRLQYLGTLAQGSSIVFDTRQGSKSISIDGVLTYNFDTQCEFFKLERGENVLTVFSVGDVGNMTSQIEFSPNYLGA